MCWMVSGWACCFDEVCGVNVGGGRGTTVGEGRGGKPGGTLGEMEEQNEGGFDLGNKGRVRGGRSFVGFASLCPPSFLPPRDKLCKRHPFVCRWQGR